MVIFKSKNKFVLLLTLLYFINTVEVKSIGKRDIDLEKLKKESEKIENEKEAGDKSEDKLEMKATEPKNSYELPNPLGKFYKDLPKINNHYQQKNIEIKPLDNTAATKKKNEMLDHFKKLLEDAKQKMSDLRIKTEKLGKETNQKLPVIPTLPPLDKILPLNLPKPNYGLPVAPKAEEKQYGGENDEQDGGYDKMEADGDYGKEKEEPEIYSSHYSKKDNYENPKADSYDTKYTQFNDKPSEDYNPPKMDVHYHYGPHDKYQKPSEDKSEGDYTKKTYEAKIKLDYDLDQNKFSLDGYPEEKDTKSDYGTSYQKEDQYQQGEVAKYQAPKKEYSVDVKVDYPEKSGKDGYSNKEDYGANYGQESKNEANLYGNNYEDNQSYNGPQAGKYEDKMEYDSAKKEKTYEESASGSYKQEVPNIKVDYQPKEPYGTEVQNQNVDSYGSKGGKYEMSAQYGAQGSGYQKYDTPKETYGSKTEGQNEDYNGYGSKGGKYEMSTQYGGQETGYQKYDAPKETYGFKTEIQSENGYGSKGGKYDISAQYGTQESGYQKYDTPKQFYGTKTESQSQNYDGYHSKDKYQNPATYEAKETSSTQYGGQEVSYQKYDTSKETYPIKTDVNQNSYGYTENQKYPASNQYGAQEASYQKYDNPKETYPTKTDENQNSYGHTENQKYPASTQYGAQDAGYQKYDSPKETYPSKTEMNQNSYGYPENHQYQDSTQYGAQDAGNQKYDSPKETYPTKTDENQNSYGYTENQKYPASSQYGAQEASYQKYDSPKETYPSKTEMNQNSYEHTENQKYKPSAQYGTQETGYQKYDNPKESYGTGKEMEGYKSEIQYKVPPQYGTQENTYQKYDGHKETYTKPEASVKDYNADSKGQYQTQTYFGKEIKVPNFDKSSKGYQEMKIETGSYSGPSKGTGYGGTESNSAGPADNSYGDGYGQGYQKKEEKYETSQAAEKYGSNHQKEGYESNQGYQKEGSYGTDQGYQKEGSYGVNQKEGSYGTDQKEDSYGADQSYQKHGSYGTNMKEGSYGTYHGYQKEDSYGANQGYQKEGSYGANQKEGSYGTDKEYQKEGSYGAEQDYKNENSYGTNQKEGSYEANMKKGSYGANQGYQKEGSYGTDQGYQKEGSYGANMKEGSYGTNQGYQKEGSYGTNQGYQKEGSYGTNQGYQKEGSYGTDQGYQNGGSYGTEQDYKNEKSYGTNQKQGSYGSNQAYQTKEENYGNQNEASSTQYQKKEGYSQKTESSGYGTKEQSYDQDQSYGKPNYAQDQKSQNYGFQIKYGSPQTQSGYGASSQASHIPVLKNYGKYYPLNESEKGYNQPVHKQSINVPLPKNIQNKMNPIIYEINTFVLGSKQNATSPEPDSDIIVQPKELYEEEDTVGAARNVPEDIQPKISERLSKIVTDLTQIQNLVNIFDRFKIKATDLKSIKLDSNDLQTVQEVLKVDNFSPNLTPELSELENAVNSFKKHVLKVVSEKGGIVKVDEQLRMQKNELENIKLAIGTFGQKMEDPNAQVSLKGTIASLKTLEKRFGSETEDSILGIANNMREQDPMEKLLTIKEEVQKIQSLVDLFKQHELKNLKTFEPSEVSTIEELLNSLQNQADNMKLGASKKPEANTDLNALQASVQDLVQKLNSLISRTGALDKVLEKLSSHEKQIHKLNTSVDNLIRNLESSGTISDKKDLKEALTQIKGIEKDFRIDDIVGAAKSDDNDFEDILMTLEQKINGFSESHGAEPRESKIHDDINDLLQIFEKMTDPAKAESRTNDEEKLAALEKQIKEMEQENKKMKNQMMFSKLQKQLDALLEEKKKLQQNTQKDPRSLLLSKIEEMREKLIKSNPDVKPTSRQLPTSIEEELLKLQDKIDKLAPKPQAKQGLFGNIGDSDTDGDDDTKNQAPSAFAGLFGSGSSTGSNGNSQSSNIGSSTNSQAATNPIFANAQMTQVVNTNPGVSGGHYGANSGSSHGSAISSGNHYNSNSASSQITAFGTNNKYNGNTASASSNSAIGMGNQYNGNNAASFQTGGSAVGNNQYNGANMATSHSSAMGMGNQYKNNVNSANSQGSAIGTGTQYTGNNGASSQGVAFGTGNQYMNNGANMATSQSSNTGIGNQYQNNVANSQGSAIGSGTQYTGNNGASSQGVAFGSGNQYMNNGPNSAFGPSSVIGQGMGPNGNQYNLNPQASQSGIATGSGNYNSNPQPVAISSQMATANGVGNQYMNPTSSQLGVTSGSSVNYNPNMATASQSGIASSISNQYNPQSGVAIGNGQYNQGVPGNAFGGPQASGVQYGSNLPGIGQPGSQYGPGGSQVVVENSSPYGNVAPGGTASQPASPKIIYQLPLCLNPLYHTQAHHAHPFMPSGPNIGYGAPNQEVPMGYGAPQMINGPQYGEPFVAQPMNNHPAPSYDVPAPHPESPYQEGPHPNGAYQPAPEISYEPKDQPQYHGMGPQGRYEEYVLPGANHEKYHEEMAVYNHPAAHLEHEEHNGYGPKGDHYGPGSKKETAPSNPYNHKEGPVVYKKGENHFNGIKPPTFEGHKGYSAPNHKPADHSNAPGAYHHGPGGSSTHGENAEHHGYQNHDDYDHILGIALEGDDSTDDIDSMKSKISLLEKQIGKLRNAENEVENAPDKDMDILQSILDSFSEDNDSAKDRTKRAVPNFDGNQELVNEAKQKLANLREELSKMRGTKIKFGTISILEKLEKELSEIEEIRTTTTTPPTPKEDLKTKESLKFQLEKLKQQLKDLKSKSNEKRPSKEDLIRDPRVNVLLNEFAALKTQINELKSVKLQPAPTVNDFIPTEGESKVPSKDQLVSQIIKRINQLKQEKIREEKPVPVSVPEVNDRFNEKLDNQENQFNEANKPDAEESLEELEILKELELVKNKIHNIKSKLEKTIVPETTSPNPTEETKNSTMVPQETLEKEDDNGNARGGLLDIDVSNNTTTSVENQSTTSSMVTSTEATTLRGLTSNGTQDSSINVTTTQETGVESRFLPDDPTDQSSIDTTLPQVPQNFTRYQSGPYPSSTCPIHSPNGQNLNPSQYPLKCTCDQAATAFQNTLNNIQNYMNQGAYQPSTNNEQAPFTSSLTQNGASSSNGPYPPRAYGNNTNSTAVNGTISYSQSGYNATQGGNSEAMPNGNMANNQNMGYGYQAQGYGHNSIQNGGFGQVYNNQGIYDQASGSGTQTYQQKYGQESMRYQGVGNYGEGSSNYQNVAPNGYDQQSAVYPANTYPYDAQNGYGQAQNAYGQAQTGYQQGGTYPVENVPMAYGQQGMTYEASKDTYGQPAVYNPVPNTYGQNQASYQPSAGYSQSQGSYDTNPVPQGAVYEAPKMDYGQQTYSQSGATYQASGSYEVKPAQTFGAASMGYEQQAGTYEGPKVDQSYTQEQAAYPQEIGPSQSYNQQNGYVAPSTANQQNSYGTPEAPVVYGEQSGYGQQSPTYNQVPTYEAPKQQNGYDVPKASYGQDTYAQGTSSNYNQPMGTYSAQQAAQTSTYEAPKPDTSYGQPSTYVQNQVNVAPQTTYGEVKPAYTQESSYVSAYEVPKQETGSYGQNSGAYEAPTEKPAYGQEGLSYIKPNTYEAPKQESAGYGQPNGPYGQNQAPQPAYGAEKPVYEAPKQEYGNGELSSSYGQNTAGYVVPQPVYGAKKPAYEAPKQEYGNGEQSSSYGQNSAGYVAPQVTYGAEKSNYHHDSSYAQGGSYEAPKHEASTYGQQTASYDQKPANVAPIITFGAEKPTYTQETTSYAKGGSYEAPKQETRTYGKQTSSYDQKPANVAAIAAYGADNPTYTQETSSYAKGGSYEVPKQGSEDYDQTSGSYDQKKTIYGASGGVETPAYGQEVSIYGKPSSYETQKQETGSYGPQSGTYDKKTGYKQETSYSKPHEASKEPNYGHESTLYGTKTGYESSQASYSHEAPKEKPAYSSETSKVEGYNNHSPYGASKSYVKEDYEPATSYEQKTHDQDSSGYQKPAHEAPKPNYGEKTSYDSSAPSYSKNEGYAPKKPMDSHQKPEASYGDTKPSHEGGYASKPDYEAPKPIYGEQKVSYDKHANSYDHKKGYTQETYQKPSGTYETHQEKYVPKPAYGEEKPEYEHPAQSYGPKADYAPETHDLYPKPEASYENMKPSYETSYVPKPSYGEEKPTYEVPLKYGPKEDGYGPKGYHIEGKYQEGPGGLEPGYIPMEYQKSYGPKRHYGPKVSVNVGYGPTLIQKPMIPKMKVLLPIPVHAPFKAYGEFHQHSGTDSMEKNHYGSQNFLDVMHKEPNFYSRYEMEGYGENYQPNGGYNQDGGHDYQNGDHGYQNGDHIYQNGGQEADYHQDGGHEGYTRRKRSTDSKFLEFASKNLENLKEKLMEMEKQRAVEELDDEDDESFEFDSSEVELYEQNGRQTKSNREIYQSEFINNPKKHFLGLNPNHDVHQSEASYDLKNRLLDLNQNQIARQYKDSYNPKKHLLGLDQNRIGHHYEDNYDLKKHHFGLDQNRDSHQSEDNYHPKKRFSGLDQNRQAYQYEDNYDPKKRFFDLDLFDSFGHKKLKKKAFKFEKLFLIIAKFVIKKLAKLLPFLIKIFFGIDLSEKSVKYDSYGNPVQSYDSFSDWKQFGIFGLLPAFILKILSKFEYFMKALQKNYFLRNFLVPGALILLVNGALVFLTWWLYPQDNYKQNYINYSGNYKDNSKDYVPNYNSYGKNVEDNFLNRTFDNFYY